ncbi:MAG: YdeI/OmpD-associated family protein [Thermoanaerobaculia bacterium]
MKPRFFAAPADFRRWLEEHHATATELVVGFHKRGSGKPSLTWPESVDEALCFGWIDGVRRSHDDQSYTIRFTPRRSTSTWSAVNIAKFEALEAADRMTPAGREAFARRREDRSVIYSYEQRPQELPAVYRRELESERRAAEDFDRRPPWYRRAATWWVVSAKAEPTRLRRLQVVIDSHARGETIPNLTRKPAGAERSKRS